jgi:hypothetical protein
MKKLTFALTFCVWAYLLYILLFLLTSYDPAEPGYSPPFVLFVVDTVNLFIHEAGHLFFKPFGMTVHILGGSLLQVLLPAALLFVTWRHNVHQIGLPGFWVGENLVNVSAYMLDAPYRRLRLIARGLIHDWNWLLGGDADVSEPLGKAVFFLGILVCLASVSAGVWFAVGKYRGEAAG